LSVQCGVCVGTVPWLMIVKSRLMVPAACPCEGAFTDCIWRSGVAGRLRIRVFGEAKVLFAVAPFSKIWLPVLVVSTYWKTPWTLTGSCTCLVRLYDLPDCSVSGKAKLPRVKVRVPPTSFSCRVSVHGPVASPGPTFSTLQLTSTRSPLLAEVGPETVSGVRSGGGVKVTLTAEVETPVLLLV